MKKVVLFLTIFICLWAVMPINIVSAANEAEQSVKLENPLTVEAKPATIIGLFIKSFLGLVGGITLVMVVWGGFQWLTAAGNKDRVESGSKTMLWALIGLIVTLSSYLLVDTFMNFLSKR